MNRIRLAFKDTRDTQIIPLIYDGKIEDAKKLALGIQTERYEKITSLSDELLRYADEEASRHIKESDHHHQIRLLLQSHSLPQGRSRQRYLQTRQLQLLKRSNRLQLSQPRRLDA